jgi:hypothetical protein
VAGAQGLLMAGLVAATLLLPARADAGCAITIRATNQSWSAGVWFDTHKTRVKSKGGLWTRIWSPCLGDGSECGRGMGAGNPLMRGESLSEVYRATFNCDANRRYQFVLLCKDDDASTTYIERRTVAFYVPSENDWTQDITLDLGDLGARCR